MNLLQQQSIEELAQGPLESLSNVYRFVRSSDIKDTLTSDYGLDFEGISFSSLKTNKLERSGKQKHIMAFNTNHSMNNGEHVRLLVTNNYEGKGSLRFNLGLFRMVCANGIVAGDSIFEERIIHKGNDIQERISEVMEIVAKSTKEFVHKIDTMKNKTISNDEFHHAMLQMLDFKHGKDHHDTNLLQFTPKRLEDKGSDVWSKFNIAQEYLIKGGYKTSLIDLDNSVLGDNSNIIVPTFKKERQVKAVKAIDTNRTINQKCWEVFETIAA